MHVIVELLEFKRAAKNLGITEDERSEITDLIAANPMAGDEISGTGGVRKVRFAAKGKGKSGGYRIITFFSGSNIPAFLITIYVKGKKEDLSQREKKAMKALTDHLVKSYARGEKSMGEIGESIIRGLQEAVDFAEGKADPKKYCVHIPDEINVQRIRSKLNMSQQEFADHFGFSKRTIQEWEQGRRVPSGATRSFLYVIDREPEAVHRALSPESV